ncbi:MAG TPA: hypothetical protein VK887_11770 [Pseudonocardiaceae bacterium]|nr:hypothetical protein [Pseudonocardiaceae bacterium]
MPARDRELADAFRSLAAYRNQLDTRRAERAAEMATELVSNLVKVVADQPDMIVEDVLCGRLGTLSHEADQTPVDERVGPHHLAEAMVTAAEDAVLAALTATTGSADAWRAPWRVLTALAGVLPYPLAEVAGEAITRLRDTAAGRVLPSVPSGPVMTGSVLWTRDRYGSRFAVAAPITTADQPVRWYLWDIDACGHEAFTVHSGLYLTPEAALAAWQAGVGQIASAGAVLAPVNDPWLLAALLPAELGFMRSGGESVEQFAEYHRSKRLAEVVMRAVPRRGTQPGGGLTAASAAVEFAAWLRVRAADQQELPEGLDELTTELADSWNINNIDAVYATCSPHRVALCVPHMRNFYLDEFADQLVALLPDWTRWLATRNATAPELADRCLPYAHGQPHPQLDRDGDEPDYLARVVE